MSRIITDKYTDKLNELIEEFNQSTNLTSLVNFFKDEIEKDQIRKWNRNRKIFSPKNLEKINELIYSYELKRIFAYLSNIVEGFKGQYLHIHLNVDLSENLIDNLITLAAWDALSQGSYDEGILNDQINSLNLKNARPLQALNNNGHSLNQIYRESYGLQHKLKLFEKIKSLKNNNPKRGILLNLNTIGDEHVYLSDFSKFPASLNTYINFGESIQYIYDLYDSILENTNTIINMFPAERGKNVWSQDFIKENIDAWNQLPGFNFNKVITITSGEKTPEALLEMRRQKKFQAEEIYFIFSFEF
jgi:hypothetical protein